MNVCRVSSVFPPVIDGRARHVWGLSVAQAQVGHRVWILQSHSSIAPEPVANVTLRQIMLPGRPSAAFSSKWLKLWFAMKAGLTALQMRGAGFDIVHAHGEIHECLGLFLFCRMRRLPLVLTIHGGLNRRPAYKRIAARVLPLADQIIAVSADIADQVAELGIPRQRIAVISSGIWLQQFEQGDCAQQCQGSRMRFVSVGRLDKTKGFTYLLSAMRILGGGWPGELCIAGDGPERLRLQAEAEELPRVRLLGAKQPEEVARLLSQADLFVLPSVDLEGQAEGTPTALMEAMAAGLPIVCTDAGGIRHLIQDGINGLVVPQRDSAALAQAIRRLAAQPELRRAMGEANRRAAESRAWPAIARQVDEAYRHALEQWHRPWPSCGMGA